MSDTKDEGIELTRDDDAFFDAVGYLIDKLGSSRDERLAELVEGAMNIAGKDPGLVTKLFVKFNESQRKKMAEPYNPFARAYR